MDELQASAGRDLAFLTKLIEAQARVAGGHLGVVFATQGSKPPRLVGIYPLPAERRVSIEPERLKILKDCAIRCRDAGKLSLFRVGDGGRVVHAIAVPLIRQGLVEGVSVILSTPLEEAALAARLGPVQWMSQLYAGHVARRMHLTQLRQAGETRAALEVLAAAHQVERFEACAMAVCNRLKSELRARRVSLGWHKGGTVRLLAMSDTEHLDRRQETSQKIEAAMEECFDQAQAVVAPSHHLKGSDEWLAQAVARCHHELIGDDGRVTACSVPLRIQERVLGVVTIERPASDPFEGRSLSHLQAIADLFTPRLHDRWSDDRPLALRAMASAREAGAHLVGPEHVGWKLAGAALLALLVYASLARWDYRIDAPFTLEAGARRVLSAPFEGFLEKVNVKPGDPVAAGGVLASLDATELSLKLADVEGKLQEANVKRIQSLDKKELADAKRAAAQVAQLEAQRDLLHYQIERAQLKAQEPGVVLTGDWQDKQGVRVPLGEPIFEVAPLAELRAKVLVDEADVDRVHEGGMGTLAALAFPDQTFAFRVVRVVPLGEPKDGRNVFEVRAQLDAIAPWMRPGMEGTAKIDAGRERVIWIVTHRIVDFLRMKLWW